VGPTIRIRHIAAWVAVFAILLAAVAPTISRMLATASVPSECATEICNAAESEVLHDSAHAAHHSSEPANKEFHFEHCPFCLTHAGSFGLLPAVHLVVPLASAAPVFPFLFYRCAYRLFVWATPQSRAPPAYSS